ncbi:MAG: tRNA uridine-5-carboxymethylaminomethyl(34) synthesis enzyme MnmG [Planctomycetes bacterium]|nr:tRNA uridine-5-carboxymethylaminomethyl(34) synthesis enzyme MnmG [Planctomycetota bacterium]
MQNDYDIIVIGGGHAGAEAAWAAANLGMRTALVTMRADRIGQMSCNPAIGGLAKGQMVREIDALGGLMALAIDATGIQFRMLNQSKGPAVRGPRAQADKYAYAREVQQLLRSRTNLTILEGTVDEILTTEGHVAGIRLAPGPTRFSESGPSLTASSVVLTTGTFMRGLLHSGESQTPGGRIGEAPAVSISDALRALGFELGRLKTGTPPRLAAESIDFAALEIQPGDNPPIPFSDLTPMRRGDFSPPVFPVLEQRPCWITQTHEKIHDLIRANLHRAPMYNGQVKTTGPRYCPSIEDKVVRFADKSAHHVFLEPESLETNEIYCNGISTSLPHDVQDFIVANMPGCERAKILKYGYAVEYDMVLPHQIDATCMTKRLPGLFLAGQINGTTGYEEAAGQGLVAGLNAVRYARQQDLVRLGRDQAYIGVLMDDLVTKVPREPYRMFTSRAEHRLILRSDNAADRLTPLGRELGLVDDERWSVYENRRATLAQMRQTLQAACGLAALKRPDFDEPAALAILGESADPRLVAALLSDAKYEPFIERHRRDHQRLEKVESRPLPVDYDYTKVRGLRNEAIHVLNRFRPATLGQARRLAGINPADLTVLTFAMKLR